MSESSDHQPIVFVGGAPRSGTTISHALLCTSDRINPYHPEISYVTPLFAAYTTGLNSWNAHTTAFFAEREHFRLHIQGLVSTTFAHISRAFGDPEILCVKDPLMTPYFPKVMELLGDRARFITVVRHPYDVIRSRQEVAARAKTPFDEAVVEGLCRQYLQSYRHLSNPTMEKVLYSFRYEDLLDDKVLTDLRGFTGCHDISPDNVWGQNEKKEDEAQTAGSDDPWYSPKYKKAINIESRLGDLDARYRKVVNRMCGEHMKRFDYEVIS